MQPFGFESTSGASLRSPWWYLVGAWTAAILFLCLTPAPAESPRAPWFCLLCGDLSVRNLVLNVVLFLPFGVGLRRSVGGLGLAVVVGFVLSLGIELAQLAVPGRFSAFGDVVANTAGTWMGALLGGDVRAWILPSQPARARLRWLWSGGASALVFASGLLLAPSTPEGVFFGNWTPQVGGLAPYPGRMLSAHLGQYPIPSERLDEPARIAAALAAQEPLALEFVAAASPDGRAPLFRLIGDEQIEVIRVDVDGADVLVRPRYLSTRLRLTRPELRFAGVLDSLKPGETVTLTIARAPGGGVRLDVEGQEPMVEKLGPSQGWIVLSDLDGLLGPFARVGDLLWGLLLFFPLGWWAPNLMALAGAVLPVLAAALLAPVVTSLAAAPVTHLALALVFSIAGHVSARSVTSESRRDRASGPL